MRAQRVFPTPVASAAVHAPPSTVLIAVFSAVIVGRSVRASDHVPSSPLPVESGRAVNHRERDFRPASTVLLSSRGCGLPGRAAPTEWVTHVESRILPFLSDRPPSVHFVAPTSARSTELSSEPTPSPCLSPRSRSGCHLPFPFTLLPLR